LFRPRRIYLIKKRTAKTSKTSKQVPR
jgi:hypothetical protein